MSPAILLDGLQTEGRNYNSNNIDQVSTAELCQIINDEDATVAAAVRKCIPRIAEAIDALEERGRKGGRVIYVGAGTSGRLGVLDASEIPPTYSASNEQIIALIAGGDNALRYAQEGAEDDIGAAEKDLKALDLNGDLDSLVGIASSGRTPYVLRCLSFARSLGCATIGIACCEPSAMQSEGNVEHMISVVTGPEVITGSTRMKAGTATKLVLNMLSTGLMVKLGKTFGNMMIDLKATNKKLRQRSRNIIRNICGPLTPSSDQELDNLLFSCEGSVKLAVASILLRCPVIEASERLKRAHGVLADVLRQSNETNPMNGSLDSEETGEYVLCVDGGGSKCAAVLLGKNGEIRRGEAGECNVSSIDFDAAMSSVSLAIQRAVDSCPSNHKKSFQSIPFHTIWAGLAGYDRPNIASQVDSALTKLFNRSIGKRLKVSSDIDLLVTSFASKNEMESVVVLVAGTGSITMSYERDGDQFIRTGRSGGWGHSLGDDGSGYGIGRQGLRLALESADEVNLQPRNRKRAEIRDPLVEKIFEHFGAGNRTDSQVDLLNQILSPEIGDRKQTSNTTRRIAEVARLVLDASSSSAAARDIIQTGCKSLVKIITSLVEHKEIDSSSSALILAGGLLQSPTYQKHFLEELSSSGIKFGNFQAVSEPALIAAQCLLQQI